MVAHVAAKTAWKTKNPISSRPNNAKPSVPIIPNAEGPNISAKPTMK